MLDLSPRARLLAGALLALLLLATRGHHFSSINLPSASLAVFFLGGLLLPQRLAFPLLFLLTVALDLIAVTWGGVSNWCVTPAYGFLLPAYGVLWFGGRLYARLHREHWSTLPSLAGCVLTSSFISHLLSSGGFWLFSGRYPDATLAGFLPRIATYYPQSLQSMTIYLVAAALLLVALQAWQRSHAPEVLR